MLWLLPVLAAGAAAGWWWLQRDAAAAVQYRTAKVERGPLAATVSASGAVNPVSQVTVGTQVSGQIKDLFVDFNSEVRAGQLIAQIDPETFEYRVRQAQADVDAARANVLTAQAGLLASRAALSRVQVDAQEAVRDLERKLELVGRQFIAPIEADRARALVNTTAELVKSAQAQVGVSEAQVKSAQSIVAQRDAQLAQARIDLARTRITSPVNGIVIKRAVEKGQTVAASLQSPELFVIARNLQDMQVDASIDESDVGRIRTGQRASFTVDAFPGQTFEGAVTQVRKAAQTVANVVTYVAVIQFANAGGRLLPGMTANVRVVTEQRDSVLKVPNAALRVRIAGIEPAAPAGGPEAGGASGTTGGPAEGAGAPAGGARSGSDPGKTSQENRGSSQGFLTPSGSSQASAWPSLWGRLLGEAHAQPGPGGGMANLRERLSTELQLSADQQTRLEAVISEMRPRFMALRDLPEDQRGPAREQLSAEMRRRIAALLNAPQQQRYAAMQAQADAARQAAAAAPWTGATANPPANPSSSPSSSPGPRPSASPSGQGATTGSSAADARPRASSAGPSPAPSPAPPTPSASRDAPMAASGAPAAASSAVGAAGPASAPASPAVASADIPTPAGGVAPPLPPGGPMVENRNRLVAELKMDAAQAARLDAIYESVRPRFMALRDLPAEERPKARERIGAEVRARISDILSPPQKARYAAMAAEAGSRTVTRGRLNLLGDDGKPRAYQVRLGITDGSMTEVIVPPNSPLADVIKEGATVITAVVGASAAGAPRAPSGPRLPF